MVQDILGFAKLMMRRIWGALTFAKSPSLQRRPQLAGRRGYGDGGE
jgi:hypothetical protein